MSPCNSSGVSIIITSAHLAASATSFTGSFSPSAFLTPGGSLAQRNRDLLDAGIAQIERVGVALAAVADNGDLLALDQVQVGVAIVVNTHDCYPYIGRVSGPLVLPALLLDFIARRDKPDAEYHFI